MLLLISQARILVQNPLDTYDSSRFLNIPTYMPGLHPRKIKFVRRKSMGRPPVLSHLADSGL